MFNAGRKLNQVGGHKNSFWAIANRVCSREWTTLWKIKWTITWRKKKSFFSESLTVNRSAEEFRGAEVSMRAEGVQVGRVC